MRPKTASWKTFIPHARSARGDKLVLNPKIAKKKIFNRKFILVTVRAIFVGNFIVQLMQANDC